MKKTLCFAVAMIALAASLAFSSGSGEAPKEKRHIKLAYSLEQMTEAMKIGVDTIMQSMRAARTLSLMTS